MSRLLDSAARLDPQRAADLMDDEALEKELVAADISYLERRREIIRQQWDAVAQMELDAMRRAGYL